MSIFAAIKRVITSLCNIVVRTTEVAELTLDAAEHLAQAGVILCKYAEDSATIMVHEVEYTEEERKLLDPDYKAPDVKNLPNPTGDPKPVDTTEPAEQSA